MKKKGFTLIELLAVIIILAVIALIATPIVLNLLEKMRIKAAESSAKGYTKAVEYGIMNDGYFNNISFDGEYDVEDNELSISYQGDGPSSGVFTIEKNKVTYGEFCINGYPIKYENGYGKYAPGEFECGNGPSFIEPEGEKCTDIENYDEVTNIKIKTVEDLVCVSNLSKNGKTFSGKTVMLLSDIDINNDNSYDNINDTTYGDINGNGTVEGIKVELTTSSGFLPIANFSGIFEGYGYSLSNLMINRSGMNNVGLFGTITNGGIVKGINIYDINVKGGVYVGGIIGYLNKGTVNEISISGDINGYNNIGGITGYNYLSGNKITSVLVNTNVTASNSNAGGIFGGVAYYPIVNGVIETGTIKGNSYAGKISYYSYTGTAYASNLVSVNLTNGNNGTSYTLGKNMLSAYDGVLDTWIGGDNDSSGYYFDYDENNKIVVKSVERNPITFTLKGEGTSENPYIISSYQQWKEATTKVRQDVYIKLNTDIDFSDKPYYAMGSNSNYLVATIDGGYHKLSNIDMGATNYFGLVGYNNGGTFKGFNVENLTISSNSSYVGGIVGYNASGNIMGLNISNVKLTGSEYIGGVVGYLNKGTVNEISISGDINGYNNIGGITGYNYLSGNKITSVLVNTNVTASNYNVGGVFGWYANKPSINGVIETGTIKGNSYAGKISYYSYTGTAYASNLVSVNPTNGNNGTSYTLHLPNTVIYSLNGNNVEVDSLSYYDSVGVLDTVIGGDNDSSGYYLDYNSTGDKIIVVPVGGIPTTPDDEPEPTPTPPVDPNFTMVNEVDGIAPTCELYYVVPVSNGIRASFSCTDDEEVPEVRSLFDSTTEKSAATFDTIGTLKSGSVSGTTKTVISTWNVNNPISQPTPGTCYYFRYGAKDSKGNFSTYVTNICYTGFSN